MNVERHSLKRLVVETQTGHFLTPLGEWTSNESDAMAFDDICSALRECATHHVEDATILLRFESDKRFDVRFPLPAEKRTSTTSVT